MKTVFVIVLLWAIASTYFAIRLAAVLFKKDDGEHF